MSDRRSRVLSSILSFAAMAGGMPIGLGIPRYRSSFGPLDARLSVHHTPRKPARSPAELDRRKRRKSQRDARKAGRK